MDPARTLDPAELLAHVHWVRRLARALVRDAHLAEDLAQETLRVTLEQPEGRVGGGAALRAWLQRVARRLALDRFRADASRVARERAVAPHEPSGEAVFEVVARSQRQRRVVDAVHELAEPYRSTILYRYFDELPTREIARRMEVSGEVVRKRLERGLAQLRERLDRDFGTDTRSWAALLLTWPGVVAVTLKTKFALSAALALAAALTWKTLVDAPTRGAPEGAPRVAASAAPEGASAVAAAATAEGDGAAQRRPESAPPRNGVVAASGGVRVRVVGPQGAPLTSGRLACAWFEEAEFGSPERARQFEVAIAGAATDVDLPRGARSCELRASVAGQPPSPRVIVTELSHDGARREVTIAVGDRPDEPRVAGRILVDGKCETPRGLHVHVHPTDDAARVHLLEGRYEVGPLAAPTATLFFTSDESVPREIEVTAGRGDVDVELTRGRTLELTVLDGATGAPLPRFELYVTAMAPTRREPPFREIWGQGSHFVVTDANGVAVVRGVPRKGIVMVRRDARRVLRSEKLSIDGHPTAMEMLREPLLDLPVDESMPDVVERTLRVDAEVLVRTVRGRLAPQVLAAPVGAPDATPPLDVRWARVDVGEKGRRPDGTAQLRDDGAFSFAVDAAGDYRVWAERDRLRVSDVAAVAVANADPDPFELRARAGGEVTLRLTHVPAKGFVNIYVNDPGAVYDQAVVLPATGVDVERRLMLDGPTWVMAGWYLERGTSLGQSQRREVDPATTPRIEIDLGGDRQRRVELSLSIGAPPPLAQVALFRKEKPHDLPLGIEFKDGASDGEVAVEPGTYVGFVMGARGVVAGEVTLADGPRDEPLRLHFLVEEHQKADLGAGVELVRVGTFELEEALRKATALRFDRRTDLAQEESILLPVGAEWTILTK
jgi:RNA polymerase sigma-70 factor (ECF subfamily)